MAIGGTNNRGSFLLINNLTITTALTTAVQNTVNNLDGMSAITAYANFTYGSGGTTAKCKVQTSLDGGTTWLDIVEFDFTTSSAQTYAGIARAAITTTSYAALSSQGVNAALLGDRLRGILTTTGTYAGSTTLTLSVSVS